MKYESFVLLAVMTGLAGAGLTRLLVTLAPRLRLMDVPNSRSAHLRPVPRGGGVAIVVGFSAGLPLAAHLGLIAWELPLQLIPPGLAVAIVGLVDDRRGVRPAIRLGVHLSAAAAFVGAIGGVPPVGVAWLDGLSPLADFLAVLAIAWTVNFFNFMDGIDGIASAQAVFVAAGLGIVAWSVGDRSGHVAAVLLAAATMGFLVWNWAPARIFMGDAGSGFLGFTLGAMTVRTLAAGEGGAPVAIILPALFFVDATITLLRRAGRGERLHEAHQAHAYQRLARVWSSHARVATLYAAINVSLVAPVAWLAWTWPAYAWVMAAALLLVLSVLAIGAGAGKP